VPRIVDTLDQFGVRVPIIGDFHYNGHILLKKFRERYVNYRGGPISGRNRLPECGAPRYARFSTVWRSRIC
jgi:hypothetical protein